MNELFEIIDNNAVLGFTIIVLVALAGTVAFKNRLLIEDQERDIRERFEYQEKNRRSKKKDKESDRRS